MRYKKRDNIVSKIKNVQPGKSHFKIHVTVVDMGGREAFWQSLAELYGPGCNGVGKGPQSGIKLRVYQLLQAALFIDHRALPLCVSQNSRCYLRAVCPQGLVIVPDKQQGLCQHVMAVFNSDK